jgi:hypothetical protein
VPRDAASPGGGAAALGRPRGARRGQPHRPAAALSHPRGSGPAAARRGRFLPAARGILHVAPAALLGPALGRAAPPDPAPARRGVGAALQDPPLGAPLAGQPDPRAPLRPPARRRDRHRRGGAAPRRPRRHRGSRSCASRSRGSCGACRSSTSATPTSAASTSRSCWPRRATARARAEGAAAS